MELNRKKFCQFRKKLTLCRNAAEVAWLLFVNPSYPNSSKDRYEVLVEKKSASFITLAWLNTVVIGTFVWLVEKKSVRQT